VSRTLKTQRKLLLDAFTRETKMTNIERFKKPKAPKKLCQARVRADILLKARKLAKKHDVKFQDVVEQALIWFIDQAKK
jgi:hypothetical protein